MVPPARPRAPAPRLGRLPWLLAGVTVAVQVPYPLTTGPARAALTVASVVAFFAASAAHAALTRGPGWTAAFLAGTLGGALAAEAVGVHTGWPFGRYTYGSTLGPRVFGVPVVVPLAWAMTAYPALLLGRRWAAATARGRRGRAVTALAGGATLTGWDLFLDPQMVAEGHWSWASEGPALNGIPWTNAAGWLLVGTALTAWATLLPDDAGTAHPAGAAGGAPGAARAGAAPAVDTPTVLLGWTYASSVLANLAFFGRPGVALAGAVGMGLPLFGLLLLTVSVQARRRDRDYTDNSTMTPGLVDLSVQPGRIDRGYADTSETTAGLGGLSVQPGRIRLACPDNSDGPVE
jgi:putative membrane protein